MNLFIVPVEPRVQGAHCLLPGGTPAKGGAQLLLSGISRYAILVLGGPCQPGAVCHDNTEPPERNTDLKRNVTRASTARTHARLVGAIG